MSFDAQERRIIGPTVFESAFEWFQRIIALYCLVFGVFYWTRLVGVYPGPLWRFDLMPVHWQVAATILAVFFPFAAIGLWMLSSWGPVIWFICAATEFVMYGGMPELFGRVDPILVWHMAVAFIYVGFRLLIFFQRRQAALTAH